MARPANHRGQLEVNEHFQATQPHIYAVGDVIGVPALASAAYIQGRFAARHLAEAYRVAALNGYNRIK
ncbi:MAG TPA: FAD-dependent oxidoreductase [Planctomycetaceae bacterium]|nr:FAD-dependent oxidoreductase [Planctomycetaceae bacterium]